MIMTSRSKHELLFCVQSAFRTLKVAQNAKAVVFLSPFSPSCISTQYLSSMQPQPLHPVVNFLQVFSRVEGGDGENSCTFLKNIGGDCIAETFSEALGLTHSHRWKGMV